AGDAEAKQGTLHAGGLVTEGNPRVACIPTPPRVTLVGLSVSHIAVAPRVQTTAVTTISTFQPGLASLASTVARAGAWPGVTHASHARFMPAKSAMSARKICARRIRVLSLPACA